MQFTNKDVCAVIISYNPDEAIIQNVKSLLPQVGQIHIYDNGSGADSREILESLEKNEKIIVTFCDDNTGIAGRLTQAVTESEGYSLILTMDQDTILEKNCVSQMVEVLNKDSRIVSVGPNRKSLRNRKGYVLTDYLITSGNLLVVEKLKPIHAYWELLFIDLVDIEASLFLRSKGYKLAIATKAHMEHKVGEYEESKFLKHRFLSHSVHRFRYMFRNFILVERLYAKYFPIFCMKLAFFQFIKLLRISLETNRRMKLKAALQGVREGLRMNTNERKQDIRAN